MKKQQNKRNPLVPILQLKKETLENEFVVAVYLSEEVIHFFKDIKEFDDSFPFQLRPFRDAFYALEEEILAISFQEEVLNGSAPFLLVKESCEINEIIDSVYGFLQDYLFTKAEDNSKFASDKEKKEKWETYLTKHEEAFNPDRGPIVKRLSMSKIVELKQYEQYLDGWLVNQFISLLPTLKQNDKFNNYLSQQAAFQFEEWTFPEHWYSHTDKSRYELSSNPLQAGTNEKAKFSYAYKLNYEKAHDGSIFIELTMKTHPLLTIPLHHTRDKKMNFSNRIKYRTFLSNSDVAGKKHVYTIRTNGNKDDVLINSAHIFKEKLTNVPCVLPIAKEPLKYIEKHQFFLIQEDRTSLIGGGMLCQNGLHSNDMIGLFYGFLHVLSNYVTHPYADIEEIDFRHKRTFTDGSLYLHTPARYKYRNVTIGLILPIDMTFNDVTSLIEPVLTNFVRKYEDNGEECKKNTLHDLDVRKKEKGKYQFFSKESGTIFIELTFEDLSKIGHPLTEPLTLKEDNKKIPVEDAKAFRVESIIKNFERSPDEKYPSYLLSRIPDLENKPSDPKSSVEQGMLEKGWITQCIKDFNFNEKTLKGALSDIFMRIGLTNQMYKEFEEKTKDFVYYFPFFQEVKRNDGATGTICTLFKIHDGRFQCTFVTAEDKDKMEWFTVEEAISKLGVYHKYKYFVTSTDEQRIAGNVAREMERAEKEYSKKSVLVFEKAYPPFFSRLKRKFTSVVYERLSHFTVINKNKEDIPTGAPVEIELKTNDTYLVVPYRIVTQAKFVTKKSKQTYNNQHSNRSTIKYTVHNGDIHTTIGLNSMRHISPTFANYLSNPLPVHMYKQHFIKYLTNINPPTTMPMYV